MEEQARWLRKDPAPSVVGAPKRAVVAPSVVEAPKRAVVALPVAVTMMPVPPSAETNVAGLLARFG